MAAVGFFVWEFFYFFFTSDCITNWRALWIYDCFWHALFAITLGSMMIIWRPGSNKKKFAYSLVDSEDSDEDARDQGQRANENFESVEMHQVGTPPEFEAPPLYSQAEEDLEENLTALIPSPAQLRTCNNDGL